MLPAFLMFGCDLMLRRLLQIAEVEILPSIHPARRRELQHASPPPTLPLGPQGREHFQLTILCHWHPKGEIFSTIPKHDDAVHLVRNIEVAVAVEHVRSNRAIPATLPRCHVQARGIETTRIGLLSAPVETHHALHCCIRTKVA